MPKTLRPWTFLICALLLSGSRPGRAQPGPPLQQNPIPVSASDPSWGSPLAAVTLVFFYDLQCPYSKKAQETLQQLKSHYGQQQLRIVYKQFPLAFHKKARPAAEAALAIHQVHGPAAFERFVAAAFAQLRQGDVDDALQAARIDPQSIRRALPSGNKKVSDDIALAERSGIRGTPTSLLNGVRLAGAQPLGKFQEVIDAQLAQAKALRSQGVPANQIYRRLTERQFKPPAQPAAPAGSPKAASPATGTAGNTTVWQVPVGNSPVQGPAYALVTMVVFSDFQCPFCGKLATQVIGPLRQIYGSKLRVVFKHNPLPFHQRAEPAAQLSMEAYRLLGAPGFWRAYDRLFAQQSNLEDADLEQLAQAIGLNPKRALAAVHQHQYADAIAADQDLAAGLEANGTPCSFINGRRLSGARPLADFQALIDEEIAHALKLRGQGVQATRLYDHIQQQAQAPAQPTKKSVPKPGADLPSKGPQNALVTIQIFADFQCPFCAKAQPTLARIERDYAGKVRLVWRHLPLGMHPDARVASLAAAEAFRQQGNQGFWAMHDRLMADQRHLDLAGLRSHARALGLDLTAFDQAVRSKRHATAIDRDLGIASAAGISGTPTFIINGYELTGAQPYSQFKRLIDRALHEARAGRP